MKWIVVLVGGGALLLAALIFLVRKDQHAVQGEEIQYDDFGFRVVEHRTAAKLGEVVPQGVFHIVRLEVLNHALRVDYDLSKHRAVLVDALGAHYELTRAAQDVLDAAAAHTPRPATIGPGESFSSELVFDVPAERTDLRLRISWGGAWIDALDWIVAGRRDIALR